jgi:hypothetical protein
VLRTAQALVDANVPARRITRSMRDLRGRLPQTMPLSGLAIGAVGSRVVVREGGSRWRADSGQYVLEFDGDPAAGSLSVIERKEVAPPQADARQWFERGSALERTDADAAVAAYERAIALDPAFVDARINLGRLLHERAQLVSADRVYREAISRCGNDPILLYNLGVLLDDQDRLTDAVDAYEAALASDPGFADCHYKPRARLREARKTQGSAAAHGAVSRAAGAPSAVMARRAAGLASPPASSPVGSGRREVARYRDADGDAHRGEQREFHPCRARTGNGGVLRGVDESGRHKVSGQSPGIEAQQVVDDACGDDPGGDALRERGAGIARLHGDDAGDQGDDDDAREPRSARPCSGDAVEHVQHEEADADRRENGKSGERGRRPRRGRRRERRRGPERGVGRDEASCQPARARDEQCGGHTGGPRRQSARRRNVGRRSRGPEAHARRQRDDERPENRPKQRARRGQQRLPGRSARLSSNASQGRAT